MTRQEIMKPIMDLFADFATGRWRDTGYVLRNFAEDGEWWIPGAIGTMTKPIMLEALKAAGFGSTGGLKITPFSWIIEGDKAAVEARGEMPLADGRTYKNEYHFVFQVKNGKVWRVREYNDTAAQTELRSYQAELARK